ncbi:N-acetyl sugar amidotransferase [Leptospira noguchii]|uniref:Queuosine biosynthesis protein QueC-like protein n=1 Tax=Leptospira noguchii TaxID=28182 RepID=M6VE24_9LEPT|nr:queuosine biosynthesis protein QueC-like protein [Leptospira noguchii]
MKETSVYKMCSRCLCDTTIPSIRFDSNGFCNFCKSHDLLMNSYPGAEQSKKSLDLLLEKIKRDGKGKHYDCIVGISGGTDSSYTLHLAKEFGLRPLAVHFDNGWNTDQSVKNIKALTDILDVDLETYVVDWEEFKDLQISFLKAGVPCIEAPTDVAIFGTLYRIANQENVHYILGGQSFKTEGTVPKEWSYIDGTYVNTIRRTFGKSKLKNYPGLSLPALFYYMFVKRIHIIPFLNYVDYSKFEAKSLLKEVYKWSDYGGHHYENLYSKFAFGYYQFHKFGIDKRKISLSGQVRSGFLSKEDALSQIQQEPDVKEDTVDYCIQKLGLTKSEFLEYYNKVNKTYKDYFTSEDILKYFKIPVRLLVFLKLVNPVLYEKYFK